MSRSGLFQMIKRALGHEERLHPVDRQMAKHWIKQRLLSVYPELRNDPDALERAYQALSLEPRASTTPNGSETVFEMRLPGRVPEP